MWSVTDNFKNQAMANGRTVECRVYIGSTLLTDSDIIEFTLNDAVHEDMITIGTTVASRFNLKLFRETTFPLESVVTPYIRFNGTGEWCPLGVFYITHRYLRRGRLSITCYDRMIRLEDEYKSNILLPTFTQTIFKEVCSKAGISTNFVCNDDLIREIPEGITFREAISYIAGVNGCCAKFDRYGKLIMKSLADSGEKLSRDDYIEFSRNVDASAIRSVRFNSISEELIVGEGAPLTTIETDNPFATWVSAKYVFKTFGYFDFYGGSVSMRGLPYFEAGDTLLVQDMYEDDYYKIVLSEIELFYDGTLSAKLYSRQPYYKESFVDTERLAEELSAIRTDFAATFFKEVNTAEITLGTNELQLARFDVGSAGKTFVQLNSDIRLVPSASSSLYIYYEVNGIRLEKKHCFALSAGRDTNIFAYHLEANLPQGKNKIIIYAKLSSGGAAIAAHGLEITAVGQGAGGSEGFGSSNAAYVETFKTFSLTADYIFTDLDDEFSIEEE